MPQLNRLLKAQDPRDLPVRFATGGWMLRYLYKVFCLARLSAITPLGAPLAHAWPLLGYRVPKGQLLENN